jgi:hypothetical protein
MFQTHLDARSQAAKRKTQLKNGCDPCLTANTSNHSHLVAQGIVALDLLGCFCIKKFDGARPRDGGGHAGILPRYG